MLDNSNNDDGFIKEWVTFNVNIYLDFTLCDFLKTMICGHYLNHSAVVCQSLVNAVPSDNHLIIWAYIHL